MSALVPDHAKTLLVEDSRSGLLVLPGARLVVMAGADRGQSLELGKEEVLIGSSEAADLRLRDETVGRLHAAVTATSSGIRITDLETTSGTRLADHRVGSAYLEFGDVVELGRTRVRLEATRKPGSLALSRAARFGDLLGSSLAARRLFALLQRASSDGAPVLLTGEPGAGKDASAEAIHAASARASAEDAIEPELIGQYTKGAVESRVGAFSEAHGGTLLLDGVGELPRALQAKILRAIDAREVRPLGAPHPVSVDVRVIASTRRDLRLAVNRGDFSEALFARLHAGAIHVPPLRARVEDVPLLADLFWRRLRQDPERACPPELSRALAERAWPGNIRELFEHVERAARFISDDAETMPHATSQPNYHAARRVALETFERAYLEELLQRARGNLNEAARLAQLDRSELGKRLRLRGLSPR